MCGVGVDVCECCVVDVGVTQCGDVSSDVDVGVDALVWVWLVWMLLV